MAGLVYKWRIGNYKNVFLTDKDGGSPFITVDIVDEEKISLIVKNFTEEEYKSKYEEMCAIIANDPDGKNMVMLNYKYYYNVDETSCGLLQYKGDIYTGEQGPSGVGIRDMETIHDTTYTILRIYLTNGAFYDVTIPNGRNGIDGVDGKDGSDGYQRNVIYELETEKEELETLKDDILSDLIKELKDSLKPSQDAIHDFARRLSGLTHSIGSATTHVDNVIGLEDKVNTFIKHSAMTKTEFNNIINPYSGFMGTIGRRIDLLSSSVTSYEDKLNFANIELNDAMSYYRDAANQMNEYWRKYDAVNNRLENVVAELTGNSTVSLSEIYKTTKEVGTMATSSGDTEVNGNRIMSSIIAQIKNTGSTFTLDATKINKLGETVASALTTMDLDINGGHSHFSADGSGWLADKSISWDSGGTLDIVANIGNKNKLTWNGFELNVDKGYFRMYGPSGVDEDNYDLPSKGAEEIDLFRINYEVNPSTLCRVSTIYMFGGGDALRIDPIEGISLKAYYNTDHQERRYLLDSTGLYFYKNDGVYKAVLEKT